MSISTLSLTVRRQVDVVEQRQLTPIVARLSVEPMIAPGLGSESTVQRKRSELLEAPWCELMVVWSCKAAPHLS